MTDGEELHLPSLMIQGFRGIDNLEFPRLGCVTLLTGKNSVGKTTVLDAVHLYAAQGRVQPIYTLLQNREEIVTTFSEDNEKVYAEDAGALFHGRAPAVGSEISIGHSELGNLYIRIIELDSDQSENFGLPDDDFRAIAIACHGSAQVIPFPIDTLISNLSMDFSDSIERRQALSRRRRLSVGDNLSPEIKCVFLGSGPLPNEVLATHWDTAVLENQKQLPVEALNYVMDGSVLEVNAVESGYSRRPLPRLGAGRRLVVTLKSHDKPVPLKSLGEGAIRMFGVAIALTNSRDGFLLIDEAENGLHHSVQPDFWRMIFRAAEENNVQVLATTHSDDCIRGFARYCAIAREAFCIV